MLHKKAYDRVIKARMTLLMDHPFFGMIVMQLKLVECLYIPTMATDGRCIFYNPLFVMEMSDVFLIGIVAHEAHHCTYRHHLRMGNRDLEQWNIATDYIINYDLREAGFKLPDWVYYDKKFAGCSSEEVYNLLPPPKKQPKPSQGKGQGKGDGQGQGGSGQPMPDEAPDPGRMGGIVPAAMPWDKATIEQESARWEAIAKQAAAVAKAQNAGTMPGFLKRLLEDLGKPRVPWEQVLTNFVDTTSNDEFTFNKLNRRYVGHGLKLPSLYSEKIRRIIGIMDTSGSVTDQLVAIYGAELSAFLDLGLADELTILYADVVVQNIQNFERGDEVKLDPKGGGGTNFRDVMNKVKEYDDASVVLFFTDLFTIDFGDEPDCPMMWVCYGDPREYAKHSINVPFGETIYIPMK